MDLCVMIGFLLADFFRLDFDLDLEELGLLA